MPQSNARIVIDYLRAVGPRGLMGIANEIAYYGPGVTEQNMTTIAQGIIRMLLKAGCIKQVVADPRLRTAEPQYAAV